VIIVMENGLDLLVGERVGLKPVEESSPLQSESFDMYLVPTLYLTPP